MFNIVTVITHVKNVIKDQIQCALVFILRSVALVCLHGYRVHYHSRYEKLIESSLKILQSLAMSISMFADTNL